MVVVVVVGTMCSHRLVDLPACLWLGGLLPTKCTEKTLTINVGYEKCHGECVGLSGY